MAESVVSRAKTLLQLEKVSLTYRMMIVFLISDLKKTHMFLPLLHQFQTVIEYFVHRLLFFYNMAHSFQEGEGFLGKGENKLAIAFTVAGKGAERMCEETRKKPVVKVTVCF